MALKLKHQTVVEFLVRAKRRYEQATGYEAARIAKKIDEWLASGDLKEEEVAKAWGAETVEEKAWTDAKKEITDLTTAYVAIETAKPSVTTAAAAGR
jgi:hypothetical protein